MTLSFRPYKTEDDYWRLRSFLRQVFLQNQRLERSWHVARFDYTCWFIFPHLAHVDPRNMISLWEIKGQLVAAVLPDGGPGEAHFQVDPHRRSLALETALLATAEERLAKVRGDGIHSLTVWAHEDDDLRCELLRSSGYHPVDGVEQQWRYDLDAPVVEIPLPAGYHLHALHEGLELLERCYASGLAFHNNDLHTAVDNRADPAWYRSLQNAPLYRRDLDLVISAADGSIASFCTIWFDDVTRSAYFEPVGTVPAHQGRGLAKALLTAGLMRLQRMGATRAFVGGFSPAANGLYRSVMGADFECYAPWVKEWS